MPELSRLRQGLCGIAAGFMLGSCGNVSTVPERPDIKPQDFALVPCGPGLAERPCALVVAGGKRVLFGAPAGVAATLEKDDLRQLDAVMLFSLRAADIEGLDEIRNETWWAGRDEPLLVVGPEGTVDMVEALNKAFEQADALRIVEEGIPPGGYDAAVLASSKLRVPGRGGAILFDTGDLRVDGTIVGPDTSYYIRYEGMEAWLEPCLPADLAPLRSPPPVDVGSHRIFLGGICERDGVTWPLREMVVLKPR